MDLFCDEGAQLPSARIDDKLHEIVFQFEADVVAGDDSYIDRLARYADALLEADPRAEEDAFVKLGTRRHPMPQRPKGLKPPRTICPRQRRTSGKPHEGQAIIPPFDEECEPCEAGKLTDAKKLNVFEVQGYRCRYCGSRTVDSRVLGLMSKVSALQGGHFVMLEGWRLTPRYAGEQTTDLAAWRQSATVDHIWPRSRCGLPKADHNLLSSCWPCQARKADWLISELGWAQPSTSTSEESWDGLAGRRMALKRRLRQPRRR